MPRLMMPRPVPTMVGSIVTLRPLAPPRDAADYYVMNLDPEMHLWTQNDVLPSIDEARSELERLAAMDDVTTWAVIDNASGRLAGRFFVVMEERDGLLVAGEGNRIARPFWRKGHNRDARRLVFRYVFDVLRAGVYETECWTENVNSRLSILANGFRLVGETAEYSAKHARCMSKSRFAITADEWRRTQQ